MTADIQWYIARDGKQYGPLSDAEMGLFVRGGHLKPDDLVWRPGFSDWTPAASVYPSSPAPAPQPQPHHSSPAGGAASGTAAPGSAAGPSRGYGAAQTQSPAQPSFNPTTQPAAEQRPSTVQPVGGAYHPQQQPGTYAAQPGATQPSAAQPGQRPAPGAGSLQKTARTGPPGGGFAGKPGAAYGAMAAPQAAGDDRTAPGRSIVAVDRGPGEEEDIDEPRGRRRLGRVAIAALLLLLLGGGWLGYQNSDSLKMLIGDLVAGSHMRSADPSIPAFVVEGDTPAAIDARLQKTALWSVVKREFPDWYGERLAETARLASEKKPDTAITQHLLEALAALRRQHADHALSASSRHLLSIADTFLANLKHIGTVNTTTCYSFISQGETSPAVVELVQSNGTALGLQAQVTAVFEAIAEGRKSPVKHMTPDKTDYDALAEQLTKLGWSQADLQLFADPRALARTSHERVCKMVQDWFTAHIGIKDRAAQERLLIETLRPVVAS